jgi:hypothetical protein
MSFLGRVGPGGPPPLGQQWHGQPGYRHQPGYNHTPPPLPHPARATAGAGAIGFGPANITMPGITGIITVPFIHRRQASSG